ncbi:hypothetical protein VH1807_contig00019-0005 [Vibrio harveyi]|nr:hypothetical protein VH1807_contig00019-0005 [Vibrio harveyi]
MANLGVLRIYKTRRFVACWGEVQLYCVVYDRRCYEMKTKVPIWALLKGSYSVPENRDGRVVKLIHALKHVHQRMMRNSLL